MRIMCGIIVAEVLVATLMVFSSNAATVGTKDFAIVKDGKSCAAFVLGSMPNEKARASAEKDVALFNKYLKKVTGVEIALVNGKSSGCLSAMRIDLKPIDKLHTRYDWKIEYPSDGVMRIEATTTSLFTALRQILEEGCDARFLGAERCMFQFEPRSDVAVAASMRQNAAHNYQLLRAIYRVAGHWRELGLDEDKLFEYSHGIPIYAFPAGKYGADKWPEEIMPVLNGAKIKQPPNPYTGWQPCYSNPRTAEIAIENIREILRRKPETRSITLGVNDHCRFCECTSCKSMQSGSGKGPFTNMKSNSSVPYYTFVNRVAEALEKEYPDLTIGLLAYTDVVMPPGFKLNSRVVPVVTLDSGCSAMDAKIMDAHCDILRKWGETAKIMGLWDYCWGWLTDGYVLPCVNFEGQAEKLKLHYSVGGRAYFGENEVADSMDGPKLYLTSRLLEDVDADPDAILSEWFTRLAGKDAEKPLREIYRRCREYWRSSDMKKSPIWPARKFFYSAPDNQHLFAVKPGFTEGLVALAQQVYAAATTPGEKSRAEIILRHMERLDCLVTFSGVSYAKP